MAAVDGEEEVRMHSITVAVDVDDDGQEEDLDGGDEEAKGG